MYDSPNYQFPLARGAKHARTHLSLSTVMGSPVQGFSCGGKEQALGPELGRLTHRATAVTPTSTPTTNLTANPLRKTSMTTCASSETKGGTGLLGINRPRPASAAR